MTNPNTGTERALERWCALLTAALLLAVPFAGLYTNDFSNILPGLWRISTSPSPLTTDYFVLAGLGAPFLNAGLCGAFVLLMGRLLGTKFKPGMTVAYILVIAHCFYGMNLPTLMIGTFGLLAGCRIRRVSMADHLNMALFNGCLGPFFGEMIFRYTMGDAFDPANPTVSLVGVALALGFSLLSGLAIPAMMPGIKKMHKGYDLYNAGITIGLLSVFLYGLMYPSFGLGRPASLAAPQLLQFSNGRSATAFLNGFFLLIFGMALLVGWLQNGRSFKGYGALVRHNGYEANFVDEFGTPLCLINIGLYGLFILAYMNLMAAMPGAAGFTGPTCGVTFAALTFVVLGQEPGDVWPMMIGYFLMGGLYAAVNGSETVLISTQPYINSFAFATGLCPIAGKYGWKWGVLAGFICAAICPLITPLHGGLMLFNGGFCAGITAMILVPILEYVEENKA